MGGDKSARNLLLPAPSCYGRTIRHDFEDRSGTAAPRISYQLIIHWNASCARLGDAPASSAHSRTANPRLNLAAARLRHIAGTAWSTKRYLNIELLNDQQIRGAITA